ncbi:MAG: hypothetical protein KA072_14725 [Thermoanaerobaculaceae bacterium]|nr:hypothetical protein [Thermoanaerobaculaceae bacterium]MDI9622958.1 hypothetical protein [Acidobacteriota bacterium]NLH11634.1 hypothetical protein [Holophagae bacterium]HPW56908.1 hypothetical protein [Thermoanaerobaculaceae bacterium]
MGRNLVSRKPTSLLLLLGVAVAVLASTGCAEESELPRTAASVCFARRDFDTYLQAVAAVGATPVMRSRTP